LKAGAVIIAFEEQARQIKHRKGFLQFNPDVSVSEACTYEISPNLAYELEGRLYLGGQYNILFPIGFIT